MIGLVAKIPLSKIKQISIYVNTGRQTMAQIKKILGCDYIINAGLFNMATFKPVNWLMSCGKALSAGGNPYGYSFNGDKIAFSYENNVHYADFVGGYHLLIKDGQDAFTGGESAEAQRGRSAIGLTADSLVLRCVPDLAGDTDYTLYELTSDMLSLGCINAVNLDGGGSSQCDFNGEVIKSSRIVHNFICVWTEKEEGAMPTYTNGNQRTSVFETSAFKKKIGALDPFEKAQLLYEGTSFYVVMYFITGTTERKAGFVRKA